MKPDLEHGQSPPGEAHGEIVLYRDREDATDGADRSDVPSSDVTPARTWRQELPRWLATLTAGRTRREYEKAVLYFFLAPGVPEELEHLTFDLLLAYRGSLALRAERQVASPTGRHASLHSSAAISPAPLPAGLRRGEDGSWERMDESDLRADDEPPQGHAEQARAGGSGPLAPATVNIRLTALRQFLGHCAQWGLLPQLPPDRMRAALRRLRIERRRPYQILAEPEWSTFLRVARGPALLARSAAPPAAPPEPAPAHEADSSTVDPSPMMGQEVDSAAIRPAASAWGVPRTVRQRVAAEQAEATETTTGATDPRHPHPRGTAAPQQLTRSRAGLTGARTALRDHALLALALATGLRAIELCALDLGDLAREWHAGQEEWWLVLPDAKTKGQRGGRTLPLAPPLVATLIEYIHSTGRQWEHAADRASPLFLSRYHTPPDPSKRARPEPTPRRRLSTEQVRRIVDRVETQWIAAAGGTDAGSQGLSRSDGRAISPHALRHSTAVALLEGNERAGRAPASVEHVRGWLGHFDIRTTQGYLAHLDARRHRRPFALHLSQEKAGMSVESGDGRARDE